MNYKFLFTAFVALMGMVLVSCSDDEATYLSEIRVSQSYVSLPVPENKQTVASASIEVDANSPWAFYDSEDTKDTYKIPSWLKITPLKGEAGKTKVTFEADSASGRECSVKILCAGKEQVINVIQGVKEVENATCAQVIAGADSKTYRVTGTCTGIYNTTYGNWYLTDETGTITIYGTLDKNGQTKNFASLGIEVGDIVTVEGPKTTYGTPPNEVHELVDVTVIKIEKSLIKVVDIDPADATVPVEGGEVKFNLDCKGNGVSVVIPTEAQDWLSMVNVTSGANPVVVFKAAPNAGGDRSIDVTFKTTDASGKEYTAVATVSQKGAIVDINIADFLAAAENSTVYRLEGVVVGVTDAAKGRFTIRDYSGEVYVYNATGFTGKVGDVVTVEGKRTSYNGTPQVGSGDVKNEIPVTKVTIEEFLTKEDNKDVYYMVTGTIDEIANATYGNLYLTSEGGARLYVYGTYPGWGATGDARKNLIATLGLEVGDELTVIGSKTTYNGTPQVNNGIYFGHVK
ncbi:BACON domain-containing protein [Sodaliphilus sp.]|uniref:BACON domain-containing protein n=1 Tax=Sodaliphilus sp. TaxID=2815818 RepID=UPI0038907233